MSVGKLYDRIDELRSSGTEPALDDLLEMQKMFRPGISSSTAYGAALQFDVRKVREIEPEAKVSASDESDAVIAIANRLSRAIRYLRFRLNPRPADRPVIVSEGDSWFQYPILLTDIVDHLSTDYTVYSLGGAGHRLLDMAESGEHVRTVEAVDPDVLMLSGGGNDLLGPDLDGHAGLLRLLAIGGGDGPDGCIDSGRLDNILASLTGGYRSMIDGALKVSPDLTIMVHGYDYGLPREGGKWLGTPLAAHGLEKHHWPEAAAHIVDRFNDAMADIARGYGGQVLYLDCRGKVGGHAASWYDELHPKDTGFGKVAKVFARALATTKPRAAQTGRGPSYEAVISDHQDILPPPGPIPSYSASRHTSCDCPHPAENIAHSPAEVAGNLEARLKAECSREYWDEIVDHTDREAYGHYLKLWAQRGEPETAARMQTRMRVRESYRTYPLMPTPIPAGRMPPRSMLERIIGKSDILDVNFLTRGAMAARSVGVVQVQGRDGGARGAGTGFLVGNGLLLTNNHVLPDGTQHNSVLEMDFERDETGAVRPVERFSLIPDLYFTDADLDISFVGVAPYSQNGRPISDYGRLRMLPDSGKALKNEFASIIQHPGARLKQLAFRNSRIIGYEDSWAYYTMDTEAGSSGSPVLNDEWLPIAIHHRTVPDVNKPCKWVANRGVRISAIYTALEHYARSNDRARRILDLIRQPSSAPVVAPQSRPVYAEPIPAAAPLETSPAIPIRRPFASSQEFQISTEDRRETPASDHRRGAIFRLRMKKGSSTLTEGTAFAVGPKLLLTAHHVGEGADSFDLLMHDFGGAERDAKQIYGISSASFLKSSASGYASDLAAIRVESSIDFRTLLKPIAPPQAKGLRIEVIGFPGTHSGLMVGASGSVTDAFPNDRALVYPINTSQGQSGAPIVRDGSTEVIGVHAFDPTLVAPLGVSDVNGGVLFDNALLKEIEKWQ